MRCRPDGIESAADASTASMSASSTPNASSTESRCDRVVTSDTATRTRSRPSVPTWIPRSCARSRTASAVPSVTTVTVSKKCSCATVRPATRNASASTVAYLFTRDAIRRSPSGPWYTAYIAATTANSTCAVQMFEVALSRRMCCSRVCSARR